MIDVGSLPGWITLVVLLAGFYLFVRGGGGVALGHLRDANEVLTKTIADQDAKIRDAERELSELRGRTDVSIAIAAAIGPLIEWSAMHEQRAQERHEAMLRSQDKTMVVLDLIASRMGPDTNGGG